jgi:hypothetical protein
VEKRGVVVEIEIGHDVPQHVMKVNGTKLQKTRRLSSLEVLSRSSATRHATGDSTYENGFNTTLWMEVNQEEPEFEAANISKSAFGHSFCIAVGIGSERFLGLSLISLFRPFSLDAHGTNLRRRASHIFGVGASAMAFM